MPRHYFLFSVAVCWLLSCSRTAVGQAPDEFFETHIRPLLVDRCIACHSAQTGKTSGGLALDTKTGWQTGGDSGPAILPGKADESLIIQAVRHADGVSAMPPEEKNDVLTGAEISLLVQWINNGAYDPRVAEHRLGGMTAEAARQWWSFQPLRSVEPPELVPPTNDASDVSNQAVDRFVMAGLQTHSLTRNPVADRRTLIRRVTFDLTGLPPTPQEIQAFLADESADAWSRVIDRLLDSPAYGERWGRHWLDIARYADTAGDGADYPVREAYKYRNWVIDAFNRNLPYDQFIQQQIAGDLLAKEGRLEEYADRVTATGFLAIGKRYGYSPSADFQHLDFADVLDTVGRSVLGISLGCARCHDHKYDPVTAQDYYALYGILQSTQWAFPGGEESKRPSRFPPLVASETAMQMDQQKAAQLTALDHRMSQLRNEKATLDGSLFAGGVDLDFEKQKDGQPPAAPWFSAGPNKILADAQSPFTHVHPAGRRGVRVGAGLPNDGLRYVFEHRVHAEPGKQIHFTIDFRTVTNADSTGSYRFYLGRGVLESLAVECSVSANEFAIRNGATWEVIRTLEPDTWYSLQVSLDHEHKSYHGFVASQHDTTPFAEKKLNAGWDGIVDTFFCDGIGHIPGLVPVRDLDNPGLQPMPFSPIGGEPAKPNESVPDWKERLAAADVELASWKKKRDTLAVTTMYEVAYGVSEGTPTNARLQKRGEPDKPGEEVPRRFLEILGSDAVSNPSAGSGRRDLAEWLTRSTNPLTARVFVNRIWQWHFGRGLVATSSDFGTRGELPSHPELLDWLAVEFMDSGWDVKSLHRTIMLSRTYQLASDDQEANLRIDPTNRMHWRFSRQPLDAESIRDAMLAVSDQLDRTMAGPHPFPPVEQWGYTIHQPFYAVYDSMHRSVYLMQQRNRRHPFLAAFDAADPNQSVAERLPTTTPTQSLYFMNSPFVHQASLAFAQRLIQDTTDLEGRVMAATEMAHGRQASPEEIERVLKFVTSYQQTLRENQTPADQLELRAWSAFARVLLTSNAFLYVD